MIHVSLATAQTLERSLPFPLRRAGILQLNSDLISLPIGKV